MTTRLVADAVFTVDDDEHVWRPGAVEFTDDLITWVGDPRQTAAAPDTEVKELGGLLMPGLVNCHGHSPMTLVRSAGDGLPLDRWLAPFSVIVVAAVSLIHLFWRWMPRRVMDRRRAATVMRTV